MNKIFKQLSKNKAFLHQLSEQEKSAFNEACKRSYQLDILLKRVKASMKKEDTYLKKNYQLKPFLKQVIGKKANEIDINKIFEQWQSNLAKKFHSKKINPKNISRNWTKMLSAIELDTECYYLIALRLLDLLGQIKLFKNMKKSTSCKPIILIANGLIKHAEKPSQGGTMELSFSVDNKTGPKVKGAATSQDGVRKIFDEGLYINHTLIETKVLQLAKDKIVKQPYSL